MGAREKKNFQSLHKMKSCAWGFRLCFLNSCRIWNLFSPGSQHCSILLAEFNMSTFRHSYFIWLITSIALKKCKKRMRHGLYEKFNIGQTPASYPEVSFAHKGRREGENGPCASSPVGCVSRSPLCETMCATMWRKQRRSGRLGQTPLCGHPYGHLILTRSFLCTWGK